MEFSSEKEMNEHFLLGDSSIESEFYDQVDRCKSQLFVRLRFSKKKPLNFLLKLAENYINSNSDSTLSLLAKKINNSSSLKVNFPYTYNYCEKHKEYPNLARSLYFAKANGNYLHLGFVYPDNIEITPCKKDDAYFDAIRNIKNQEGVLILELVECLLNINEVTSVNAKFIAVKKGCSGLFWSREEMFMEYLPQWDGSDLPAKFW